MLVHSLLKISQLDFFVYCEFAVPVSAASTEYKGGRRLPPAYRLIITPPLLLCGRLLPGPQDGSTLCQL
jgi:hypothetical protein